ncbi:MAG: ATP-binding protein [Clostridia bacterium]|nr:ATP-binding protein [Clostridia bacterium]
MDSKVLNMTTQQLLAPFRRAINDYDMIQEGDCIAVGVSGGKDSLTLLALLHAYARFCPQHFTIKAFTIDLGFEGADYSRIEQYCVNLGIEYHVEKTTIGQAIFEKTPNNPCSLCSKMRRGALNTLLLKHGCNKLALGHHADDVIETFFLSLLYEGRLSTFAPISYMSRTGVTVIRPLIYVEEWQIASYAKDLPVYANPCPADKNTQREYMKQLIKTLNQNITNSKQSIIGAVENADRYNLWDNMLEKYRQELKLPDE